MARNAELTDRQRMSLFGSGGGLGSFMYNYGPSGAPSNAPPTAFERGLLRDDPSNIRLNDPIQPGEGMEPTQELGVEDTIFQILMETIIGEQGIPEGVSAEAIEAVRSGFDGATISPRQLQEIAIDIAEAGGFDEWLEDQEEEEDIDKDSTLEDEIGVDPDMPIDIPFPTLPPREEEEEQQDGRGSGTGSGTGQNQGGQQGEYEYPDYPQGDPNYGYPNGLPGGGRGGTIYDVPVQEEPGFIIVPAIPSISTGGGGGGGSGGGGTVARTAADDFTPFMARLSYQPGDPLAPVLPEQHTIRSLFSEYF